MVSGGPWGCPGASRKPPGSLLGAGRDGFWIATKFDEGFEAFRACPGGHFGSRPGPKNPPKIDLWRKRWPRRKCRGTFSIDFRCHLRFSPIFQQFSMIFQCFFRYIFQRHRLFFSSRRTFKSIGRASVLSTFCFFRVFHFLQKTAQKLSKKFIPQKNTKNGARR